MSLSDFRSSYLGVEERGDVVVARFLLPQLTDELNVEQLGTELFSLAEHYGFLRVVVDLQSVELVTSSIVGKLIMLHRRLHRNEGKLAICNLQPRVDDVMRTSRLNEFFHIADDVPSAVELVSPSQADAAENRADQTGTDQSGADAANSGA